MINSRTVCVMRPPRKSVLRPNIDMVSQDEIVPMAPMAYWIMFMVNAMDSARPAEVRKTVDHPIKASPVSIQSTSALHRKSGKGHTGTGSVLNEPSDRGDLSSAPVDTLEAVPVLSALADGLFHGVGVHHKRKLSSDLFGRGTAVEALDGPASVVKLAVTDLPPGRFGRKEAADGNGDRLTVSVG